MLKKTEGTQRRGFTLLETLVAMMILSGGILLLANSWSGNFMRVSKSRLAFEVTSLLQRKMAELEVKYKDKPSEIPEEEEGDFGDEYKKYKWQLKSKKFEMPDLSSLLTSQEGGADEMLIKMVKSVTEFISKSVTELKLTVIVDAGKRPLKYSVTTLFVDFNQDLPLPGLPSGVGGGSDQGDDTGSSDDTGGGTSGDGTSGGSSGSGSGATP